MYIICLILANWGLLVKWDNSLVVGDQTRPKISKWSPKCDHSNQILHSNAVKLLKIMYFLTWLSIQWAFSPSKSMFICVMKIPVLPQEVKVIHNSKWPPIATKICIATQQKYCKSGTFWPQYVYNLFNSSKLRFIGRFDSKRPKRSGDTNCSLFQNGLSQVFPTLWWGTWVLIWFRTPQSTRIHQKVAIQKRWSRDVHFWPY